INSGTDVRFDAKDAKKQSDLLFKTILYLLLPLPALFLLTNNYPYLLILSVILIVSLSFLSFLLNWKITKFHSIVLYVLLIIFCYFIVSFFITGQSLDTFSSFNFLKYDGNFFFCYILFFALAVPFFDYESVSRIYFNYLFGIFTVFGIFGIFEYLTNFSNVMTATDPGAGKMFIALNYAHNATGSVYAVASLFVTVFLLTEKNKKLKIFYLFVLLVLVASLFLTKSRGSYIGYMVGAFFIIVLHYRDFKKIITRCLILAGAIIALIFATGTYKRFIDIFSATDTAIIRSRLWAHAWQLFVSSPIFGIGFGRFNDIELSSSYKLNGIRGFISVFTGSNIRLDAAHAHNSYFQFLSETGLVGIGLLFLFWGLCFGILIRAFISNKTSHFGKRIYLCGITGIITLFILAFTENYLSATTIMTCMSMVVSLGIGLYWQEMQKQYLKHN
ncbi:MAG: O-antigen ligase family protein, partial [Actinomycetota bacterium]|nr:O-antigen ligase family protein [Actinomycetota bacterium]